MDYEKFWCLDYGSLGLKPPLTETSQYGALAPCVTQPRLPCVTSLSFSPGPGPAILSQDHQRNRNKNADVEILDLNCLLYFLGLVVLLRFFFRTPQ